MSTDQPPDPVPGGPADPADPAGRAGRALRLPPRQPTHLPGTHCEIWWDGDTTETIYQRNGHWDLSPLIVPGRVHAWQRLSTRPHLGWWPLLPLSTRRLYRAGGSARVDTTTQVARGTIGKQVGADR